MEDGPSKGLATLKSMVNPSEVWFCSQPNLESHLSLPPQWTRQDWWELADREWCPLVHLRCMPQVGDAGHLEHFSPCFPVPCSLILLSEHRGGSPHPFQVVAVPVFSEEGTELQRSQVACPLSRGHTEGKIQQFLPLPQQLVHSAFQSSSD